NHAYLVDVREGNVTGGYSYGPEPLTTVVHGLYAFLSEAQSHKLPMDKFGVIGFDRSAGIDLRTLPLSDTSDPAYSSFMDAMTPSQKDKRMENYFFFPRHESGANYPEALKKALAMLRADPDAARARNFVAMIGTGLTDCDSNRICGRLETDYQAAMAETESILANEYVPNEVEFSFIQVGTMTRPHTILSKSVLNPNSCRTEREARAVNPPVMMVDEATGSWTLLATLDARGEPWSMTRPFYADPARLYRAVRATGGVFGAIRTPCLAAGVPADVTATLNAACQAAPSSGMKGGSPDQPIPVAVSPYTDANGRLICDPNGRSTRDQMRDYLKEILAGPPYLLVRDAKKLR
ncbi:MAG: hypothetical protein IT290_02735, partial [Deltaproteobacteria bacterium]|nr:hypothetical protein [Deltaproteobacteria bacterium]